MTMAPSAALRVAVFLLVADGLAALYLGGLLGPAGAGVVALVAAGAWWNAALLARLSVIPRLTPALGVVAALALAADLVLLAPTLLDAFTHLLVFLLVLKLYLRRTLRDARDIAFLAFFMLVAVAPVTLGVAYLLLFLVFLAAGTWLLVLRHVLAEAAQADPPAPEPGPRALGLGRGLLALSLAASAVTVAVTAGLFFVIPRVGQAALPLRAQPSRMVSGFSERVALGAFGEIELDDTVIMRVHLPGWSEDLGSPEQLANLRWRGIAFDRFDGTAWTVGRAQRVTLRRHVPVAFALNRYRGGPVLAQEIYLEPMGTDVIFAAPRIVRLQGRSDFLTMDDLGTVTLPAPAARLRYSADSELEVGDPRAVWLPDGITPPDPAWRARYVQLPPLAPRVAALAREVTADSRDTYEAAVRLTRYLSREFAYTRALERRTTLDPVEEFLFVRRSGNCEYFAAALAVLLRSIDIPARVVNGFQRGEWNPYGRYFMVRLRDAHSWVEVFVNGHGWVTLDPSPRAPAEVGAGPAATTLWLDALRLRWYRHVINWSLHDQLAAALTVRRTAGALGAWSLGLSAWGAGPRLALGIAGVAIVAGALLAWRRRAHAAGAGGAPRMPRFYERALRAAARRDLRRAPGETAREFAARVADAAPAWEEPFRRLTLGYERVRFGARTLSSGEAGELEIALAALEGRG